MAHAADWNDEPTETFERRIHSVLGTRLDFPVLLRKGAFDELWAGWYWARGAEAAVKVLTVESERAAERVLTELRLFQIVEHPALVQVLDIGLSADGRPFLAMELLKGETLEDYVEREGPLGVGDALRLVVPVVDGLVALHDAGLVHRDVRPGTVFLSHQPSGRLQPKLFGFAIGARSEPRGERGDRMHFWAPEVRDGEPPTAASDVFAAATLALACVDRTPRSSRRRVSAPRGLDGLQVLGQLLEPFLRPRAADRRGNARELRTALVGWLADQGYSDDATGRPLVPSRR